MSRPLYTPWPDFQFTEEARRIQRDVERRLQPIVERAFNAGLSPRDIAGLIATTALNQSCMTILANRGDVGSKWPTRTVYTSVFEVEDNAADALVHIEGLLQAAHEPTIGQSVAAEDLRLQESDDGETWTDIPVTRTPARRYFRWLPPPSAFQTLKDVLLARIGQWHRGVTR